jgi:hypothetical protein
MIRHIFILSLAFLAFGFTARAQSLDELLKYAYLNYDSAKYSAAEAYINQAIATKKGQSDETAWYIRGFIYKDIYVEVDKGMRSSKAREYAVESLMKSNDLDLDGNLYESIAGALKYLSISYYNDASEILRERKPEELPRAEDYYNNYKSITLKLYPDSAFLQNDILFLLSLATANRKIYESDREANEFHWHMTNKILDRVLELDPLNYPAYYSLGVSYYNKGASNLEKIVEADIADIVKIQGESIRSIKVALPFMLRAYEINPESIETVKGIKWIHFNLDDQENYKEFDNIHRELELHRLKN